MVGATVCNVECMSKGRGYGCEIIKKINILNKVQEQSTSQNKIISINHTVQQPTINNQTNNNKNQLLFFNCMAKRFIFNKSTTSSVHLG